MNKVCNKCKEDKDTSLFYLVNKRGKETVYHMCKLCCQNSKSKSKDYYRDWELKHKYGISIEEYRKQSLIRNNQCDICNKMVKSLHVDHCHSTGVIRGYLCGSCNRGIGLLQDSHIILQKALEYLKRNDQTHLFT